MQPRHRAGRVPLWARRADGASVLLLAALPLAGLLLGPAYATLAWVNGALRLAAGRWLRRSPPRLDIPLAVLATMFCALCLLGATWSIAPVRSLAACGQLALILAASLAVLADRSLPPAAAARAFGAMSLALFAGVAVLCVDRTLHFPLERHLAGRTAWPGTKYNRGEDYLTLLLWPLLAFWWLERRFSRAFLVAGAVLLAMAAGLSTTARVTVPVGFLTLFAAFRAPAATRRALAWFTVAMAATLPFDLRMLASDRAVFWPYLKQSGLHRLEIWNYMTARVFEHPLLGWGLSTAKLVPIRAAEQQSFVYVDPRGVYPHQQWLQLWLETGVLGVLLGTAFALLVLRRVGALPRRLQPFACAAFAAAMAVSFSSFEITTDSWWAALALTALLLRLAGATAMS